MMGGNKKLSEDKLHIVISTSNNPYVNLAVEELLLGKITEKEPILYLWQNAKSVIIGRNQNPCFECNFDAIKKNDVKIVRRMTGGGAVYHDMGNLNYSFVWQGNACSKEFIYNRILAAINMYVHDAALDGRNDIVINGMKVSGTAFLERNGKHIQHGCILISTDLVKMSECLSVNPDKLSGKRIDSVRSRVANLVELNSAVTIEKIRKSIIDSFKVCFSDVKNEPCTFIIQDPHFDHILEKYKSDEWNYGNKGNKSAMTVALHHRFSWGDIDLTIKTDGITVLEAEVYSDSLEAGVFELVREELLTCKFEKADITNHIQQIDGDKDILKDICNMIVKETQIP